MKLQRLLTMPPSELLYRTRQEVFKTLERLAGYTVHPGLALANGYRGKQCQHSMTGVSRVMEKAHRKGRVTELVQQFQDRTPPRFFTGASDVAVPDLIASLHAKERSEIIASADAICRGEFAILGYGKLKYRTQTDAAQSTLLPLDWQLDPISGQRSRDVHWSLLDPLDLEQVGDSKVVWELNRHQWMLDLGQAWQFTGEEHYARTFAQLLRDWMEKNPAGVGINWTSALEVSLRMISWCWALLLFRHSAALSASLIGDMLAGIRVHAVYIERYLSRYYSPNTHLTGEALGLFYVGILLPELKESARWRVLGQRILEQEIDRQIHDDGVFFEQSTCYQYYTIDIYLHFLILARRNALVVSDKVHDALQRMLDFVLALRRPDGSVPAIGDADGGWLLPLVRRSPGDFRALFATAAVVLNRAELYWAAGIPGADADPALPGPQHRKLAGQSDPTSLTPETLWLLGPLQREGFSALTPHPPPDNQLQLFPAGGYAVMRNHWQPDAHHLIFDFGPLGGGGSAGHGHADLLSVQCSIFGQAMLVDAGTGCYTGNPALRNYFRSTSAHSTVRIDGRDQAEPAGPFSWKLPHPAATLLQTSVKANCAWVDASYVDIHQAGKKITHRRRIAFIDKRYWIIVDEFSDESLQGPLHNVSVNFQFADLPLAAGRDKWIRAPGRHHGALLLKAFSLAGLDCKINSGKPAPDCGWLSPNYGQYLPAPSLQWHAESQFPLSIVTLLYPVAEASAAAPEVRAELHGRSRFLSVASPAGEVIQITDQDISVTF